VQNRLRLQLLLAVLGQHRILLLRGVEQIDDCGAYLWQIKYFLLRLKNPLLQPAFVVCDTDIAPRMAFSVERLLVVENGLVETVAVEF